MSTSCGTFFTEARIPACKRGFTRWIPNRVFVGVIAGACALAMLFPQAEAFAQCSTKADPPLKRLIELPGERVCCSLGTQTGIDPNILKGHVYGNQATLTPQIAGSIYGGEPDGYIYTTGAGLVDIGHVRDNADMVLYVYVQLLDGQHTIYIGDQAAVPNIPTTDDDKVALAGAIVFTNSWAHELTTWGYTNMLLGQEHQDFSAFSPEDLSSNIVGIEAASRAISQGGGASEVDFSKQMDSALPTLMKELGAQTADVTNQVLVNVKYIPTRDGTNLTGKWWMDALTDPGNLAVSLLRRNFDGQGWKVTSEPQTSTPAWLNTKRFSDYYSQFLYFVDDKHLVDVTQVPRTNAYALATGLTMLQWVPTAFQSITPDAREQAVAGGIGPCLTTTGNVVIPNGQYATVSMNVDPGGSSQVIWSFQHATKFLDDAFTSSTVGENPGMDGPLTYVAPAAKK